MNIKRVGMAVGGFILLFAGVKAVETVNGWRTAIFPTKAEVVEKVPEVEEVPRIQAEPEGAASPAVTATLEEQQAYAQVGEDLINRFDGVVQTSGEATEYAHVRVVIPRSRWEQLTPDEKIAITYYTQSMISEVRQTPANFMTISKDAPIYSTFVGKLANLCDDCWGIVVSDTDTPPYSIDETVVTGDGAWDPGACCQGVKGSDFRSAALDL